MSNISEINVAILAGGLGTRLAPILPGQQKVISKVRNHPFLEYILNQLDKTGFKNIVLCTGYLGDQVQKVFGKYYKSLSLNYSKEQSSLGTAGAIRFALPLLASETILVTNGDSFCDVDFEKFLQFHLGKNSQASLVISSISEASRYGKVELGKDNKIIRFEEKKEGSGAGFINAGIYLINKALIAEIPKDKKKSIEKDVFPTWVGKSLYGYRTSGRFIDIGTPESYKEAKEFFSQFSI